MALSADSLKRVACDAIDQAAKQLNEVSQDIWSHPELLFEEHHAHQVLTDFLEKQGFPVERKFVLDTGFRAVYGTEGKPSVAVMLEFDALPNIGHACGHNLIAEAGAGAGIGIKAALDAAKAVGQDIGQLVLFGTPAEESGGGKVHFIQRGAFDNVDCALMVHPWNLNDIDFKLLARVLVNVKYLGKASHAAGFPWEGINALDAAVMAYTNISVLRQQMKPSCRIHGVILNGGAKPNIIPEETELQYYIRAPTVRELKVLKEKVVACFDAAATATGCKVEYNWGSRPYENMMTNVMLANLYADNIKSFEADFPFANDKAKEAAGSTDMGNVSHVVPSIHPMYYIGSDAVNHTRAYTGAAGDPKAQSYTIQQAKTMAMTAIDVYCQPELVTKMKAEFEEALKTDI